MADADDADRFFYVTVTPCACAGCGKVLNVATSASPNGAARPPEQGDFCVCMGCGKVLVFHGAPGRWTTRSASAEDLNEADAATRRNIVAAREDWRQSHGRPN